MQTIYINYYTGELYDEYGNPLYGENSLNTYLDNVEKVELHYVESLNEGSPTTWQKYVGFKDLPIASVFAIDNNFITEIKGNTLNNIVKEDIVESLQITINQGFVEQVIPTKGFIITRNSNGDSQSWEYGSRTFNDKVGTFALSQPQKAGYNFGVGTESAIPESLMCLASEPYNAETNKENWIDDSRKDEGIFTFSVKVMSPKLIYITEYDNQDKYDVIAEHAIISNGDVINRIQFNMFINKPLAWHRTAPIPDSDLLGVATKAWILSLYNPTRQAFTAEDVVGGTLTIDKVKFIPVSISDELGVTYPLVGGTVIRGKYSTSIDIQTNLATIGKEIIGTWYINFAGGVSESSGGGSVPPEVLEQIAKNKQDITTLGNTKVDKVKGKSLIDDTEITRLKDVKNYDDTQVKADVTKLQKDKADKTDLESKADKAIAKTELVGTTITVKPNTYSSATAEGACSLSFEGWDAVKLESSYVEIAIVAEATLGVPEGVEVKGDKLEAGANYKLMVSHTGTGYLVIAIKGSAL